jgi:hypothetical protein
VFAPRDNEEAHGWMCRVEVPEGYGCNGATAQRVEPNATLAEVLRGPLDLSGTKTSALTATDPLSLMKADPSDARFVG